MRLSVCQNCGQVLHFENTRCVQCRAVFGDDSQDYAEALQRNDGQGPTPDWQQHVISTYAACHPWEDFAQTRAHYLHMIDTLDMAGSLGPNIAPHAGRTGELRTGAAFDAYGSTGRCRRVDRVAGAAPLSMP